MAVLKCKMCGGDLTVADNTTVTECEYCGSKQTIPVIDNDKKIKLYERANKLRFACEFDKAAMVYESIVEEFADEAEAYWGLVLCKYGIEYVDDPGTGRKVPTCHRSSFDSVMRDENFELVMENADSISLTVYRAEAKVIEEIRKGIIEVSSNEEPYDIFICYKETDENGDRTLDSVLAQDVYEELVEKGYRVFFSRITLEDKIGQEYEPFIFAALNSAKVMLAFGSKYEYYNAVWVKNEWSRFLKQITSGQKKILIPCYKNLDAYDMPEEFTKLQAQDMGKVGAIQDLLRGIEKIIGKKESEKVIVQSGNSTNIQALLKRGNLAIEDGDWKNADVFFEEVLNQEAESAEAYLGKLLVLKRCRTLEELSDKYISNIELEKEEQLQACDENQERIAQAVSKYVIEGYFEKQQIIEIYRYDRSYKSTLLSVKNNKNRVLETINQEKLFIRAKQFAIGETKNSLDDMIEKIIAAYDEKIAEAEKNDKQNILNIQHTYEAFLKTADEIVCEKYEKAIEKRENDYNELLSQIENATTLEEYKTIRERLVVLKEYKDSEIFIKQCIAECERIEKEQVQEEKRRLEEYKTKATLAKQKRNKIIAAVIAIVFVIGVILALTPGVIKPAIDKAIAYDKANELLEEALFDDAKIAFEALGTYKDSENMAKESIYQKANTLYEKGDFEGAIEVWNKVSAYSDSIDRITAAETMWKEPDYQNAQNMMNEEKYEEAAKAFKKLGTYKDSEIKSNECDNMQKEVDYKKAMDAYESMDYITAMSYFRKVKGYKDANILRTDSHYNYGCRLLEKQEYISAIVQFEKCKYYKDAEEKMYDAMYKYVIGHMDSTDSSTQRYLGSLKEVNYANSRELYKKLYP